MILKSLCYLLSTAVLITVAFSAPKSAFAHPHVFIDGSVDFVLDDKSALTALSITWRYDAFETLYVLTSIGIVPSPDGALSESDRAKLVQNESEWPDGFNGAANLSIDGDPAPISGPRGLDANLEDGRLVVRFRRDLNQPTPLRNRQAEVAFFERTYYYAFTVATEPKIVGLKDACNISVNPFVSGEQDKALQATLAKLGREETPEDANVGALFADRIVLTCA